MNYTEIRELAARAWNGTKPDDFPLYDDCVLDFRDKLANRAESTVKSNHAFDPFEERVLALARGEVFNESAAASDSGDDLPAGETGTPEPESVGNGDDHGPSVASEEPREAEPEEKPKAKEKKVKKVKARK